VNCQDIFLYKALQSSILKIPTQCLQIFFQHRMLGYIYIECWATILFITKIPTWNVGRQNQPFKKTNIECWATQNLNPLILLSLYVPSRFYTNLFNINVIAGMKKIFGLSNITMLNRVIMNIVKMPFIVFFIPNNMVPTTILPQRD